MSAILKVTSFPPAGEYDGQKSLDRVVEATRQLQDWIEARDYAGYEPYDILNSPLLSSTWLRQPTANWLLIQVGRRWAGEGLRHWLRIPASKNPKALGLMLAGYCDRLESGEDCWSRANYLKSELQRLRSPGEELFCWGYDWDFVSLRGSQLPAFGPNAIATVFCGDALLDFAEITGDEEAAAMAASAGRFIATRLNRSVETAGHLCFSYTPADQTKIYNSSALAAAFLARLGASVGNTEYLALARRAMRYLCSVQQSDGSWFYGAGRLQRWIDNFHTAYNLMALMAYRKACGDDSVGDAIRRGYRFYETHLFNNHGAPKYFHNALYPIDIHCCSQAILTFCDFSEEYPDADRKALQTAIWTLNHLRDARGYFHYQQHRLWRNRTPYMRWGQAWMFRALARLQKVFGVNETQPLQSLTHEVRKR